MPRKSLNNPAPVQRRGSVAAMRDEATYPQPALKPYIASVRVPAELREFIRTRMREENYSSESRYFLALAIFDLVSRCRHWLTPDIDNQQTLDALVAQIVRDFPKGQRGQHSSWVRRRVAEALAEVPPTPKT